MDGEEDWLGTPYIVLRHAPDFPFEHRINGREGKWMLRPPVRLVPEGLPVEGQTVAVATGEYEFNDSGQAAQVYRISV